MPSISTILADYSTPRPVVKHFLNVLVCLCVRIISGELSSLIVDIPVFVPQMTGIEASQCHDGFGIVFIPPHSRPFKAFGEAAAERLRRSRAYVVALLNECGVIRHGNTLG